MKTYIASTPKCLNPSCERSPISRGLCNSCYTVAAKMIKENKTTWKKLEDSKKALPKNKKTGKTINWFLS